MILRRRKDRIDITISKMEVKLSKRYTSSKECMAVTNHKSIQKKINEYTGDSNEKTNSACINASDRSPKEFNVAWKLMIIHTIRPVGLSVR